mgnify:CR=1 FL=1
MKILYISLLFLMNCVLSVAQPEIIIPKPHQLKWHEAEMGAVFHYDLHVFDGIRYGQGNNRISPIEDSQHFQPHPIAIPTNGSQQLKPQAANSPYSQPPMKPASDCGKVT